MSRWPLLDQIRRRDPLALGDTAASPATIALRPRTEGARQVDSVCPYCATGCGLQVAVADGRILSIEGDARSPVSRGRLCPKGQATFQLVTGSHRLDRVMYRRPHGTEWETLPLDAAMDMVADRIVAARDATWEDVDEQGRPLRRTTGIGAVGGATLDNEESYMLRKLLTALGVVAMDNQARICHSPTPAGLGATWGRGGATSTLADLAQADVVLIMGSNMAETHVVGFQWVMEAKARGATVIHVDPRFTRTSSVADVYAQIRPGSDLVFLGALVHHVLSGGHDFREFVLAYTNAATLVSEDYVDAEDLDGVFSGWDPERGEYDPTSWAYDHGPDGPPGGTRHPGVSSLVHEGTSTARHDGARTDPTLTDPRCVYRVLARHFARYTPELVEETCGIPRSVFLTIADTLVTNSGPDRTGTICYAVGWTMHMHGAQLIRTAAILQTLLGNIGRPGGGIMALRGHSNVQGTTDVSTLYETLPAYLAMPTADDVTLDAYLDKHTAHVGLYGAYREYVVSQLAAWFGDAATADDEWGFGWLPRLTGDASYEATIAAAADGAVRGYLVMGQNPVVGAMNAALQRKAYRAMDWMVVRDPSLVDTAEFWRDAPEIERGEVRTEDIATEVFVFPAAMITEKSGTLTNTQRLLQWHDKAIEPPGDATSDLWWVHRLGLKIRARLAGRDDPKDAPVLGLAWDYSTTGADEDPDPHAVLREMNGVHADGTPVTSAAELRTDGSTRCGLWIYAGALAADGTNLTARRPAPADDDPLALGWGWTWPANRHVLYNRCSARPDGTPWSDRKRLVWWDAAAARWTGLDVPDFPVALAPDTPTPAGDAPGLTALDRIGGTDAFIAKADGKAWLFAPSGLRDGPLPTHYEPLEGGVRNRLHRQQSNPARAEWRRADNPYHQPYDDPDYPYVCSTNRLTEMYGAGTMSRWLPWLAELQPASFLECSPAFAVEIGVRNGDWVTVSTARASIEVRALVTERIQTLVIDGRPLHHVGLNYHFGRKGLVTGDPTNELVAFAGEPNTTIQGSKVFSVAVVAGRRAAGPPSAPTRARDAGDLDRLGPRVTGPHGYVGGVSRAFGLTQRWRKP